MSANIDDGGQAFPRIQHVCLNELNDSWGEIYSTPGMTLRDWFAGMALQGIISSVVSAHLHNSAQTPDDDQISRWAYGTADAMLAARKGGQAE